MFSLFVLFLCGSASTESRSSFILGSHLPLVLEGVEVMIWEEEDRMELRLEEEGLGCGVEERRSGF